MWEEKLWAREPSQSPEGVGSRGKPPGNEYKSIKSPHKWQKQVSILRTLVFATTGERKSERRTDRGERSGG